MDAFTLFALAGLDGENDRKGYRHSVTANVGGRT
jgi:hypothetical protein